MVVDYGDSGQVLDVLHGLALRWLNGDTVKGIDGLDDSEFSREAVGVILAYIEANAVSSDDC